MSSRRRKGPRSTPALAIVLALATGLAVFVANGLGATGGGKTLNLWLGGDLTQATPGSPYRQWVEQQAKRFSAQNPGWTVKYTLLPFDNAQNSAKLAAAFAAHNAPDVMALYSGQFTNLYKNQLQPLNKYVSATPGLYKSIPEGIWSLECIPNYECNGGKNTILGIPWNAGTYFLYYNKALMAKAGISRPPTTYTELFADCKKLSAKGITPVAMGANDGYDTSNIWTTNLVSTLKPGDVQRLLAGTLPYNAPALVAALEPVLKLTDPSTKCTSPNALGEDQLHGTQDFQAGKAAMTPYFSLSLTAFRKALGSKLGLAKQPLSGHGPLLKVNNGYAGVPFDGWVIPKGGNADMAWKFIKLASDATANASSQKTMGFSPAISSVTKSLTDPLEKLAASFSSNPAIPELDQVMPNAHAIFLYRQLSLGQEQKQSAAQTLAAVQSYVKAHPQP
jgi:ABC-type glycerol-3-phosphate transport system substrate-binding protein